MNLAYSLFIVAVLLLGKKNNPAPRTNPDTTAEEVLKKVSARLNNLQNIRYKHRRELNYPSRAFFHELTGDVYLDFTSTDTVIGTRYFFQNQEVILAFNGSESFVCENRNKGMYVNHSPRHGDFENLSFLNHSIFSLKRSLAWITADRSIAKEIRDTMIGGRSYSMVFFSLFKAAINTMGERWSLSEPITIRYRLLIDNTDFTPVEIYQTNNLNDDFLKTIFSAIEVNGVITDESFLFYSSYLDQYTIKDNGNTRTLIKPGSRIPERMIKHFPEGKEMSLSDFRGHVILLNFWICNCSYCIANIPGLNSLATEYAGKNFRIIGVNAYDAPEMISRFVRKRGPVNYELFFHGGDWSEELGIPGFPTYILVDKDMTVRYTGAFDKKQLKQLIDKHL